MNNWPDYQQADFMAKRASDNGFEIRLEADRFQGGPAWKWTWRHKNSGMTFDGFTTAATKEVALICALQSLPTVMAS